MSGLTLAGDVEVRGRARSRVREMLLVGRGGEGVMLASQILADAFARAGFWVQSFPEFKAERRGAPISAFLRWDRASPIHRRYKMRECDVLVALSPAVPPPELLAMVRPGGLVVLNHEARLAVRGPFRIARVPASRIARDCGILSAEGRPLGNVAVLGASVRLLMPEALPQLELAVAARIGVLAQANLEAARLGYAECTKQRGLPGDEIFAPPPTIDFPSDLRARLPVFPVSTTDSLASHTGSWSTERPQLLEACTACGLCALFCPEGAISRIGGTIEIDEFYCKGCGICEVVCPVRGAIAMEAVAA